MFKKHCISQCFFLILTFIFELFFDRDAGGGIFEYIMEFGRIWGVSSRRLKVTPQIVEIAHQSLKWESVPANGHKSPKVATVILQVATHPTKMATDTQLAKFTIDKMHRK